MLVVSTHSRLKAAGPLVEFAPDRLYSFNTQPPEGGWSKDIIIPFEVLQFQHTAA